MLLDKMSGKRSTDIVNEVFAETDYEKRLEVLEKYSKFWMGIAGARGMGGKNAINPTGQFGELMENSDNIGVIPKTKDITPKKEKMTPINLFED